MIRTYFIMKNLLTAAYFPQGCPHCGGQYTWTLEQILQEQRLQAAPQGGRPCNACHSEWLSLVDAVPRDELEELARAWEALRTAVEGKSLQLHVGAMEQDRDG